MFSHCKQCSLLGLCFSVAQWTAGSSEPAWSCSTELQLTGAHGKWSPISRFSSWWRRSRDTGTDWSGWRYWSHGCCRKGCESTIAENSRLWMWLSFHRTFLWPSTRSTLTMKRMRRQTVRPSPDDRVERCCSCCHMCSLCWSAGQRFRANTGQEDVYVNSESGSESDWGRSTSLCFLCSSAHYDVWS